MGASQGRATEESVRPQPQRFRMNVPQADEAVLAWMKIQDNHSLSLRMLIRENIERHGYIDVMNRPVEQLPKRGRPVAVEEDSAMRPEAAAAAPVPPAVPAAAAAPTDLDFSQEPPAAPELLGIALQSPAMAPSLQVPAARPVAPAAPAPVPSTPEPPAGGQVDVNDIFSSIR